MVPAPGITTFDISAIFSYMSACFQWTYLFLDSTYIKIFAWDCSLFELFCGTIMIYTILTALVPWFWDEDLNEDD